MRCISQSVPEPPFEPVVPTAELACIRRNCDAVVTVNGALSQKASIPRLALVDEKPLAGVIVQYWLVRLSMVRLPSTNGVMAVKPLVLVKLTETVPPVVIEPPLGRKRKMLRRALETPMGNSG